jgi:hypothetical protein
LEAEREVPNGAILRVEEAAKAAGIDTIRRAVREQQP